MPGSTGLATTTPAKGVTAGYFRGAYLLIGLSEPGVELSAPGSRHVVRGLCGLESGRGFIELLVRDRLLLIHVLHAAKCHLRQIEIRFRGGDGTVSLRYSGSDFLAGRLGAPRTDIQFAWIESNEQLAFANVIAGLHLHFAHIAHQFRGDDGGSAGANGACRFVDRRPRLGGCRDDRNGDGPGRRSD